MVSWSVPRAVFAAGAFLVLLSGAPGAVAQPTDWADAVAEGVQRLVAERWEVPPEALVLEWGSYRGEMPAPGTALQLLGSGAGGHWVVRFLTVGGAPASVRVRAGVRVKRPVAARRIERGEVLAAGDIATGEEIAWGEPRPPGPAAVEGWVAQRLIRPGEVLRPPVARPPLAVESGRPVQLLWRRGGVGLRLPGRAVGSATLGQEVYVRTELGERLRGVVVAPGVVDVSRTSSTRSRGMR